MIDSLKTPKEKEKEKEKKERKREADSVAVKQLISKEVYKTHQPLNYDENGNF